MSKAIYMEERWIFDLIAPIHGSKIWRHWHMVVGGWEISGGDKRELLRKAIRLTERELIHLRELQERLPEPGEETG